jgi:hypothetical protein
LDVLNKYWQKVYNFGSSRIAGLLVGYPENRKP